MATRSAYVHLYRKFSKGIFHGTIEEIGVEGVAFHHQQWIVV
jgi:hypothetical protein